VQSSNARIVDCRFGDLVGGHQPTETSRPENPLGPELKFGAG